jgi:hypothetical protein
VERNTKNQDNTVGNKLNKDILLSYLQKSSILNILILVLDNIIICFINES